MSDLAIKRAGRIYQKRLYRWLLLILVIWLIPAFFFSFGVFVVVEAAWKASVRKAIRQLETSLVDVAMTVVQRFSFKTDLTGSLERSRVSRQDKQPWTGCSEISQQAGQMG